ncbi:hypothetical protein DNL40_14565 [Xylanimonas oleitrophica]|uniref:Uncharacterized protein n=1 Tax=Xylanimonas oleitrophica TaxID=2607479 RepID=A0A2W5WM95_9MICO|nr:DUF6114 domain-containing protein [Xylanimonas oleitrophica]PZR51833.1 hypothetical protein DNL40_14565 [Xylanimonas oleitrophica]
MSTQDQDRRPARPGTAGSRRERFARWRRRRPFVGALLIVLAGVELFLSGRIQLDNLQVQLGFAGMQSTLLPVVLVLVGVLAAAQPAHHVFYGVITLAVSVYSLMGVNLGGFGVGMLLGVVGGIVVVSWMPSRAVVPGDEPRGEPGAGPDGARAGVPGGGPDGVPADVPDGAPSGRERSPGPGVAGEGPAPGRTARRSTAVALGAAMIAGGAVGPVPAAVPAAAPAGPCLLGFILCGGGSGAPAPVPTVSPSPGQVVEGTPGDEVDVDGDGVLDGVLEDVTGDGILDVVLGEGGVGGVLDGVGRALTAAGDAGGGPLGDAVGGVVGGAGDAVSGAGDALTGAGQAVGDAGAEAVGGAVGGTAGEVVGGGAGGVPGGAEGGGERGGGSPGAAPEPASDDGVTVEVPPGLPAPHDEELPVVLGGNEDVDVYSVPGELKARDLRISGLRAVALVSVPVAGAPGERRNALKIVADHITTSGFELKTYAYDRGEVAGTYTTAESVVMEGDATIYVTSLTAPLPDGSSLRLDAEHPPQSVTGLLLALTDPTVGLLGATSDRQTWNGFSESVWSRTG